MAALSSAGLIIPDSCRRASRRQSMQAGRACRPESTARLQPTGTPPAVAGLGGTARQPAVDAALALHLLRSIDVKFVVDISIGIIEY
jgi:hypothetical protein